MLVKEKLRILFIGNSHTYYNDMPMMVRRWFIEEDYGKGGFDPIKNPHGHKFSVVSTTYYDEEGNVVSSY